MGLPLPDVPHQLIAFPAPLPQIADEPAVALDLTGRVAPALARDRKSTRLNSSH